MTGLVAKLETFGEVVLTGSTDELVQLTSSMTNPKFSFVMVILQPVAVRLRKRPIAVIYTVPLWNCNNTCWFTRKSDRELCRWSEDRFGPSAHAEKRGPQQPPSRIKHEVMQRNQHPVQGVRRLRQRHTLQME
jgi:hypothetical protein